jgi:large subunit ribosomal protein L1
LGRKDFDLAKLEENFAELKRSVQAMKPVNWKGSFVRNVTLSSTMSPGIKVTF